MNVDEVTMLWSGAALRWRFLADDGTPANYIHRSFAREIWSERDALKRAQLCLASLAWPLAIPLLAGYFTCRNGPAVKRKTGKGLARQMAEQIRLAGGRAILPPWYYILELYHDENRRRAGEYLNRFETKRFVYKILRKYDAAEAPSMRTAPFLSDKALFAARCQQFGCAAVPALRVFEDGELVCGDDPSLPRTDLFLKPLHGAGGRGAERWDHLDADRYRAVDGTVLGEGELIEHLKRLSRTEGYIVRPRVMNHPEIADLSNGALATVRVMTCRDEAGRAEATNAVLRMAQGRNTIVDNFHAGGIVAKVDVATGELGRGVDGGRMGSGAHWREAHPDTGARFFGRRLPCWEQVCDLARRAHDLAFADEIVVGWDIALLPDGPHLIEGNKGPCVDLLQRPHQEPLGNARLGQLLAFNLKRALEAKHAGAPAVEPPRKLVHRSRAANP
jgi:hypothetical protein